MTRSSCSGTTQHLSLTARVILRVASALVITSAASAQSPPPTRQAADPIITAADRGRILGSENARLWMLVVSDFQCPFCKEWHDATWSTIQREYVDTGKIRVAYVNFPLGMHPNARPAAIEAMCAGVQGKFWPLADALFRTQERWKDLPAPQAFFDGIAASVQLDQTARRACIAGRAIPSLIDADQLRMTRAATQSTPTFFIGGSRLEGAQPIAQFRRVIDAELAGRRP